MKIRDKRGDYMKELHKSNRTAILAYFEKFPEATREDCCNHLKIAYSTLQKHLKEIESEG